MIETWMTPVTLNPGVTSTFGAIAVDGSDIHLVYPDAGQVKYRKSTDDGSTFSAAVTIGGGGGAPLTNPISVDGQYVHVVYERDSGNAGAPPKLYYVRSTDGGANWSSEVTLDDGTGVANNRFSRVSLRAEGGYVHLFWCTQDSSTFVPSVLSYRRSTDNGANWAAETTLANSTGAGRPDSVLVGNVIHLVWTDTRDGSSDNGGETYYMKSTDRGDNWGIPVNLSNTAEHNTIRPTITGYSQRAVVAWQYPAGTPGSEDIIWRYSADTGASWSTAATLVTGTGSQEHPSLASLNDVVAIAWTNQNDSPDRTYVKLSRDHGASWSTAQVPYVPGVNAAAPLLYANDRLLFMVDDQTTTSGGIQLVRSPVFSLDPQTTVLLDDFNRADDATPPPGANWSNGILSTTGGIAIVSNQACRALVSGIREGGYWNVSQYTDADLIVEVSAWAAVNNDGLWLYNRVGGTIGSAADSYTVAVEHFGGAAPWSLARIDNNSQTTLVSASTTTIAVGDKIALTCRGNLLIAWRLPNGSSEWLQIAAVLDSTYTSGYLGMEFTEDTASQHVKVTNFWGSAFVEPVETIATPRMNTRRSRGGSW